jgi:hypothetical protein
MFYQSGQNHLQRDAVKGIFGFFFSHMPADKLSLVSLPRYYNILYLRTYSSEVYTRCGVPEVRNKEGHDKEVNRQMNFVGTMKKRG